MKIIKIKYILITISYFVSFYLIYKTFKLVVPNNEIPLVRQNIEPLRVEIKPIKTLKKLEIYEIINEKEEVQEKEQIENTKQKLAVNLKSIPKTNYDKVSNDYRLQFASIRFKTKINKLITEIKSKSNLVDKDFITEEVDLPNLGKFFRIQSSSTYDKINAEKKCKELLIKKQQCLIVKIK